MARTFHFSPQRTPSCKLSTCDFQSPQMKPGPNRRRVANQSQQHHLELRFKWGSHTSLPRVYVLCQIIRRAAKTAASASASTHPFATPIRGFSRVIVAVCDSIFIGRAARGENCAIDPTQT